MLWCRRLPAGSVTNRPLMITDPDVTKLVHQEMTAETPVTLEMYGPRTMNAVPTAGVLTTFGVLPAETLPAESTAWMEYEYRVEAASPLSEKRGEFGSSTVPAIVLLRSTR